MEEILAELSHQWFERQIDRYFIERLESFERVSFQMFRTTSKGIAIEAHQRLVEEEESWQDINERWGLDSEKQKDGIYSRVSPKQINKTLYKELKRLKNGEISEPIRTNKTITIIKLIKWEGAVLNQELRKKLEEDMYKEWLHEKARETIERITKP